MADVNVKKVSTLVGRMIPPHIVEQYPTYVRFIQAYFEYTERQYGEYDMIANILGYGDIDNASQIPAYFAEYKKQYLSVMPGNMATDSLILIKNIRDFYRTKGTEESFKILFRAIYDKDVDFYYPSVDILRVSDGKWTQPTYLIPIEQSTDVLNKWVGVQYKNETNTAYGIIEHIFLIDDTTNAGSKIYAMLVSSNQGGFELGDAILSVGASLPSMTTRRFEVHDGYWQGDDGKLSSVKKVQDSFYYQDFSYEILCELSIIEYADLIKRVLHPAGMAMFGKFTTFDGTLVDVSQNIGAIWLLLLSQDTSVREGVIRDTENVFIGHGKNVPMDTWTFGYIDANRENNIILNRFPTAGSFDYLPITAFLDPLKASNIWPATDISPNTVATLATELGDIIILEDGLYELFIPI